MQIEMTFDLRHVLVETGSCDVIFAIVYDMQTNGVLPTFATIYDHITYGAANVVRNLNYRQRYKVIKEHRGTMQRVGPCGSATGTWGSTRTFSDFIKLPCLKTTWATANTGAPVIADVFSGALYAVFGTRMVTATDIVPNRYGVIRVRFIG